MAKYDSADDQAKELISALKAAHAVDTTTIQMETDHPFSHHRIGLESAVIAWRHAHSPESAELKSKGKTTRTKIRRDHDCSIYCGKPIIYACAAYPKL